MLTSLPSLTLENAGNMKYWAELMETWDELACVKEKELIELRQQKDQHAAQTIKGLEEELCEERRCLSQLKGDFEYNLSLLDARDEELAQYEASFKHVKSVVNALVAENSDLKVRLDGACKDIEGEKAAHLQLHSHHQARLKEVHSRMDSYRRVKQAELDEERGKLESLQRELRNKLLALEGEGHAQRQHMMADFDEALKKRDHEHQLKLDQFSSSLLEHQTRGQHLERELARTQSTRARLEEELQCKTRECEELEKCRKEEVWHLEGEVQQLQDVVQEWACRYQQLQEEMGNMRETFQRKHSQLDRAAREKQVLLDAAKQAHVSQEHNLEEQCTELHRHIEKVEGEWSQREHALQQTILEKDNLLERMREKMAAADSCVEKRVHVLKKQLLEKDCQLQSVLKEKQECKAAIGKKDKDLDKLTGDLCRQEEKVRVMEQRHAEQQLDWEGRVREAEKMAYFKQQQLINELSDKNQKLSVAGEQAKRSLDELMAVCARLRGEKDAARELLSQHNIPWPEEASASHMTEILRLQSQNRELHEIIGQMRAELEQLSDLTEQREREQEEEERKRKNEVAPSVQYVAYLEKDVCRLKAEIRQMSDRLAQASKPPPTPKSSRSDTGAGRGVATEGSSKSRLQQQHVDQLTALTDTIASLQRENGELERACQDWKEKNQSLQNKLREEKELLYLVKASHTPQTRLHQKLLQATQVIISLVREKELMSAHIQHLVSGTLPSITGKLPSSDARHEVSGTPSSASQEGRQAGGMPLSPEGRLQQQSKVSLETKLVQTSPNWQLGRVSVEGLRPVEVKMKGSSTAEPGVGRGLAVAASMETGRRGTGGEEIGRLRDKGMAKWPEGGRTGGQAGGRTGGQAGGERTQVSRDLEETSRAAGTTSGQQHWRVATEVTGTVASRNEVVEKIGKHNGIKSSRKAMSFSPTGASPTYPAALLDQSLPSLQFSESSLDGGAAALEELLEQVDQALASDKDSWTTEEAHETGPSGKRLLEMVGKEVKTHTRPARQVGTRSHSGRLGRAEKAQTAVRPAITSKTRVRKPRNYNIKY